MSKEQELRRVIKAVVLSLESIIDATESAVKEINKEKHLSPSYKTGAIDATNTIGESVSEVLALVKDYMSKIELPDDCQCANCKTRRALINKVAARNNVSKEDMDTAIMAAIEAARANGKQAGAIKVNRTTGEVEVISDDELSDELRGAVDALARGEDVGLEEYKLEGNDSNDLNAAIKSVFTKEFDGISQEKTKATLTSIFTKMDKVGKDKTDC